MIRTVQVKMIGIGDVRPVLYWYRINTKNPSAAHPSQLA